MVTPVAPSSNAPALIRAEIRAVTDLFFSGDDTTKMLAAHYGMPMAGRSEVNDPLYPLVVAAASAEGVSSILKLAGARRIDAVITWRLDEAQLARLYDIGCPVFVGLPTHDELLTAVLNPPEEHELSAARTMAAQLSDVQSLLERAVRRN
jgi:hypothetical protein